MKVLDTKGILHYVKSTISKSKDFLYIFSPYLNISDDILKLLLETKLLQPNLKISIICGKEKLEEEEYKKIQDTQIKLYFVENLHAKIMINEKYALVSSMNLYKASESNYGILFSNTRKSERKQYNYLKNYCESIFSENDEYSKVIGEFEKKYPFKTENWHQLKKLMLDIREDTEKWEYLQDSVTEYAKYLSKEEISESNTFVTKEKYNALVTICNKYKKDFLDFKSIFFDLKSRYEMHSERLDMIEKLIQEQKEANQK